MVTITGTVMCKGIPDGRVKVFLKRKKSFFVTTLGRQHSTSMGRFFINVQKSHCTSGLIFVQILHQCMISKHQCYIKAAIPLKGIATVLKRRTMTNRPINVGNFDVGKYYPQQQFLCTRQASKIFNNRLE